MFQQTYEANLTYLLTDVSVDPLVALRLDIYRLVYIHLIP